ncbi:hypothetical protein [Kribbella sp. NPDC004875]|uniref:hypothetical protein n=1 Tax=Kribbella sp. NPDC004875 TaxID=3364107 RepID=UPI003697C315
MSSLPGDNGVYPGPGVSRHAACMTAVLALARPEMTSWSRSGTRGRPYETGAGVGAMAAAPRQDRLIRLTSAGVLAFSICLPAVSLTAAALAGTPWPVLIVDIVTTVLYVPLFLHLVWMRITGRLEQRPRPYAYGLLAAIAVLIIGALPWASPWWPRALSALALAVLIVVPAPWSWIPYVVLWLAPIPLARWSGHPELWVWGVLPVNAVLGPYVLLRLIDSARALDATRRRLAADAVDRERLRIDEELRRTVGTELVAIAHWSDRALAAPDTVTRSAVERIVEIARTTLAGARRLIKSYRQPSVAASIDTAVELLSAGGVRMRVSADVDDLEPEDERVIRPELRAVVGRLLAEGAGDYRLTVTRDGVRVDQEGTS